MDKNNNMFGKTLINYYGQMDFMA